MSIEHRSSSAQDPAINHEVDPDRTDVFPVQTGEYQDDPDPTEKMSYVDPTSLAAESLARPARISPSTETEPARPSFWDRHRRLRKPVASLAIFGALGAVGSGLLYGISTSDRDEIKKLGSDHVATAPEVPGQSSNYLSLPELMQLTPEKTDQYLETFAEKVLDPEEYHTFMQVHAMKSTEVSNFFGESSEAVLAQYSQVIFHATSERIVKEYNDGLIKQGIAPVNEEKAYTVLLQGVPTGDTHNGDAMLLHLDLVNTAATSGMFRYNTAQKIQKSHSVSSATNTFLNDVNVAQADPYVRRSELTDETGIFTYDNLKIRKMAPGVTFEPGNEIKLIQSRDMTTGEERQTNARIVRSTDPVTELPIAIFQVQERIPKKDTEFPTITDIRYHDLDEYPQPAQ